jgi:predicted DNA binding CopG/RHH family protein
MKVKVYELDPEEQEILKAYDRGEFVPIKNQAAMKRKMRSAVAFTLAKRKNINIRLTELDLHRLKVKAMQEGIPYQTLAASILHKYAA